MKLTHKLKKFARVETFKRALFSSFRPLPTKRFLEQIDPVELARIQKAYDQPGEASNWRKYTDVNVFLKMNIHRVQELALDKSEPLHILDIGSGAGYFLFVCRVLGHTGYGLDLREPELYEEMFRLFGLKRGVHRVENFQPLPEMDAKYDLITAFSIVFNNHSKATPWGTEEWDYFLKNADSHLKPGGRIFLNLNPMKPGGPYCSDEVRDFFLSKGAKFDRDCNFLFPPKS
ncbi:MAG: methyltransferase domain-containing protein [Chthoniobacterales bacterium]